MKVQQMLADVLGIEWRYTITRADQVQPAPKAFRLEAIDPPKPKRPPFDLDRMCREALRRVNEGIEDHANAALENVRDWRGYRRRMAIIRRELVPEFVDVSTLADDVSRFEQVTA